MTEDTRTETQKNLDEAGNVRYLGKDDFLLFQNEAGGLKITLKDDRSYLRVKAKRCFPFANPSKFISLRDGNDEEIGIIADITELPKDYRRFIKDELEMRYYTPKILCVKSVRSRYTGMEWLIETDIGPKKIITKSVHDAMTEIAPGHFILTDVDENRYGISFDEIDKASRMRLERLV